MLAQRAIQNTTVKVFGTRKSAKAHIVALGDSQTYVTGVGPEDVWPRPLRMSMGSDGHAQTHPARLESDQIDAPSGRAEHPKVSVEATHCKLCQCTFRRRDNAPITTNPVNTNR